MVKVSSPQFSENALAMSSTSDWLEMILKNDFPSQADFQESSCPGCVEITWIEDGTSSRPCHSRPLRISVETSVVDRWIEAREPEQQFISERVRAMIQYARMVDRHLARHGHEDRMLEIRCDMIDVWLSAP